MCASVTYTHAHTYAVMCPHTRDSSVPSCHRRKNTRRGMTSRVHIFEQCELNFSPVLREAEARISIFRDYLPLHRRHRGNAVCAVSRCSPTIIRASCDDFEDKDDEFRRIHPTQARRTNDKNAGIRPLTGRFFANQPSSPQNRKDTIFPACVLSPRTLSISVRGSCKGRRRDEENGGPRKVDSNSQRTRATILPEWTRRIRTQRG